MNVSKMAVISKFRYPLFQSNRILTLLKVMELGSKVMNVSKMAVISKFRYPLHLYFSQTGFSPYYR